jgi:sRNA-binding protein
MEGQVSFELFTRYMRQKEAAHQGQIQGTPLSDLEATAIQKAAEEHPEWQAEYMKLRLKEAKQEAEAAASPPKVATRVEEDAPRSSGTPEKKKVKGEKSKRKKRDFFDTLQRKNQKVKEGKLDSSNMSPTREEDHNLDPEGDSPEGSQNES